MVFNLLLIAIVLVCFYLLFISNKTNKKKPKRNKEIQECMIETLVETEDKVTLEKKMVHP